MYSKALYYPTMDIKDEDWLKNAYLFWDNIYTIAPNSLADNVFHNNTTQYLEDVGYLKTIKIGPDTPTVRGMVEVVKEFAKTKEGLSYLSERSNGELNPDPFDDQRNVFYLHHEKLPYEVQALMRDRIGEDGWARVSENFADYYMTLLATTIARQRSMALLTSEMDYCNLSTNFDINYSQPSFTMTGRNGEMIGQCMLTKMIIEGLTIDPLVSIEKLCDFKRMHEEELRNFRNGLDEMAKMDVPPDITIEGLEQKVRDIYENKFLPEYNNLKSALQGFGIDFLLGGASVLAFTDISSSFKELLSNLSVPKQLIIGSGAILTCHVIRTAIRNIGTRREHRMSYLLSIEKELGVRRRR